MTSYEKSKPIRIAMWSGPRNISTAMMRSFGGREDCAVTDEPFYGAYLKTTGIPQPMADQVIDSMDCDWTSVAEAIRGPVPEEKALWYQKHMPHHMVTDISITDFPDHRHAFLIRDPVRVVASYAAKRVEVTVEDLGYERMVEYVDQAEQITGKPAVILDSADILSDPEAHLRALCSALDIPWDAGMLHWEAGGRETDGIWAAHWYNRVVETTGFGSPDTSPAPELGPKELRVVEDSRPFYERLSERKIRL